MAKPRIVLETSLGVIFLVKKTTNTLAVDVGGRLNKDEVRDLINSDLYNIDIVITEI